MKSSSAKPYTATVTESWAASYPDPIVISAGTPLTLTGREDIWDGHRWLWAVAPDGRAGWVPDTFVGDGVALSDYSAQELSCSVGEALTVTHQTHGWCWCENAAGGTGWVPARCLSQP